MEAMAERLGLVCNMTLKMYASDVIASAAQIAEICTLRIADVRLRLSGSRKAWQALKTRRGGMPTVQCPIQW